MKRWKKTTLVISAAVLGLAALAGCDPQPSSTQNDQKDTNTQLERYQKNQPAPQSDWSQYRQTVIDVEMAQIHGVATTSFFFNQGVVNPIKTCPSIGFAVATTSQLTNPSQVVWGNNGASGTIGQAEPNGVYTGESSGTYVICVSPTGKRYVSYWEGFVQTEGGPAHWDVASGQIVMDGDPTVLSTSKK